jgi:hypothetical protein
VGNVRPGQDRLITRLIGLAVMIKPQERPLAVTDFLQTQRQLAREKFSVALRYFKSLLDCKELVVSAKDGALFLG